MKQIIKKKFVDKYEHSCKKSEKADLQNKPSGLSKSLGFYRDINLAALYIWTISYFHCIS